MFKPGESGSARPRRQPAGAPAPSRRGRINRGNGSPRRAAKAHAQLHDKQSERDHRELRIDKVGVRDLRFPIQVRDKARAVQNTVATIGMYVDLPRSSRAPT